MNSPVHFYCVTLGWIKTATDNPFLSPGTERRPSDNCTCCVLIPRRTTYVAVAQPESEAIAAICDSFHIRDEDRCGIRKVDEAEFHQAIRARLPVESMDGASSRLVDEHSD